ncbi:ISL3 family transposase [Streptomyces sp. NPDC057748]|uniref:ISL3 family transposase n=1 Tax=unclassified Streptomyces TaxID=2593676 RepID=UPI0036B04840
MNETLSSVQELLFPSATQVAIETAAADGEAIRIEARCTAPGARCPVCDTWSTRVHGSYLRSPADLPCAGQRSVISPRVRRYVCANTTCPRQTFVEQAPGLTRRHGRTTERLRSAMGALGLALAGRAGARLAAHMGIGTSRNTLLRRVLELPDPEPPEPTAIGVDDFALRKGHVYGTVITDAVTHRVLDLLPERDAATLTSWLAAHPGIEVICRDRASAYAEAADTAAPQAQQVADRFHLWQNIARAVERTAIDHRSCLREFTAPEPEPEPQWETPVADDVEDEGPPDPTVRMADRRRVHHAMVHELLDRGMSMRAVARHLGWGVTPCGAMRRRSNGRTWSKGTSVDDRANSIHSSPTWPGAGRRPAGRSPGACCSRRSPRGATGAAARSSPSGSTRPSWPRTAHRRHPHRPPSGRSPAG